MQRRGISDQYATPRRVRSTPHTRVPPKQARPMIRVFSAQSMILIPANASTEKRMLHFDTLAVTTGCSNVAASLAR
eukprot:1042854-Alexandrium_andersonii.AAC.1